MRIHIALGYAVILISSIGARADSIATTTLPDSSGLNTVTGTNTSGGAASWKAGGHLTYTKTVYPQPPASGPGYYQYNFTIHNESLCTIDFCSIGLFCTYFKTAAVSGAGANAADPDIVFWGHQRVYIDGVEHGRSAATPSSHTLYSNQDVYEEGWAGPTGTVTNKVIQFKVGSWQGSADPWQSTAATPGL